MSKTITTKKTEVKKEFFNRLKVTNFLALLVAAVVNSVGVGLLLLPAGLIDANLSGLSILLSYLTPINVSIFLIVLNVPFYLLAIKKLGLNFIIYSLFSIGMYSLFVFLFNDVFFAYLNGASPITNDLLLCAIFGGLLSGVGSGLTIRFNSSLDGLDVVAVIISKKIGINVATLQLILNIVLYIVAGILISWTVPLYSLIAYAIGNRATDTIVDGIDKARAAMIITAKGKIVAKNISTIMGSSVTVLKGKGFYSDKDVSVLYCVVNRFEMGRLKFIVKEVDSSAFIAINDVTDVLANNGRKFNKERVFKTKVKGKIKTEMDEHESVLCKDEAVKGNIEATRVKDITSESSKYEATKNTNEQVSSSDV